MAVSGTYNFNLDIDEVIIKFYNGFVLKSSFKFNFMYICLG